MERRFWLSGLMLAVGASLLLAAGVASPASSSTQSADKKGGTLRIVARSDWDYIDPSEAYFSSSWSMEYATTCRLFNRQDGTGKLIAEVAAGQPTISKNGRTYTFTVKKGFRFSDGKPVTAANFAWALNRALKFQPDSPAAPFINDKSATDIVGSDAARAGKAATASGIKVKGSKLIVTLVKPSPQFITQMSMPFFSAMPTSWPAKEVGAADTPLATCGPYYVASWQQKKSAVVKRNPYYKGDRPHNVAEIDWTRGVSPDSQQLLVEKNEADIGGFPPTAAGELNQKYGPSKRFRILPRLGTEYLVLNTTTTAFRNNAKLRLAVNYAIGRKALIDQEGYGAGKVTDQILPPGMPGYKNWKLFGPTPDTAKAKKLATPSVLRDKTLTLYTYDVAPGPQQAQLIQAWLKPLGITTNIKTFDRIVQQEKIATKGEPFDISYSGWIMDYPDPYDFINVLLYGGFITETANNNTAYFDSPVYNKKMEQAASQPFGTKRWDAYAQLDKELSSVAAPWANYANLNAQVFLSNRVKKFVWDPIEQTDFAALELK